MAAVARGCTFRAVTGPVDPKDRRTLGVEVVWGDWVLQQVVRPCDCWRIRISRNMRIKDLIAHLFDYHIMERKNWTLEQLAAWVETVEPKETQFELGPGRLVRQRDTEWSEFQRFRQKAEEQLRAQRREAEEWRAVRDAFEARPPRRRKLSATN